MPICDLGNEFITESPINRNRKSKIAIHHVFLAEPDICIVAVFSHRPTRNLTPLC